MLATDGDDPCSSEGDRPHQPLLLRTSGRCCLGTLCSVSDACAKTAAALGSSRGVWTTP